MAYLQAKIFKSIILGKTAPICYQFSHKL